MRYPASEKLEIIRIVEQSHMPVRRTLDKLGILPGSFYRWYDRYQTGGVEAFEDKPSKPLQVWNRIPDDVSASSIWRSTSLSYLRANWRHASRIPRNTSSLKHPSIALTVRMPFGRLVTVRRILS